MSYKVTIKNESGDTQSSRVYIIYSDTPKVSGGGVANARPLQWAKTKALGNGGQDVFKYTSESFGFVGYSSISPSSNMSAGTEITLDSSVPAIVGSFKNDGSEFYVKENDGSGISINDTGRGGANSGTLTISCDAGIPSPSTYVVGLARKSERDGIAPVAAVECKPRADFTITPSSAIFIARGDQGDGTVLSNKTPNQRVEFRGNSREATVSETSSGSFSVVYK
ncbi:Fc.00g104650.m01.CDS01 [Cosmosporella sp. VM-42]